MIEVESLVKWFGPTLAVDRLSFQIPAGQIVGFLGPNGAGKSTTLRIITGYLPPTSGRATIAGFDVLKQSPQARAKLGYLPENTPLYPEMRVEEYLDYRGRLLHLDRARRKERIGVVCDRCGLAKVRRRLIGQLSRGNRQRVGLAQALLHDPPLLILDEPTAGLDPNQIVEVRKLITELRGSHTILLSTHILTEVEKIADRVLIIAGGQLKADGSPEKLLRQAIAKSPLLLETKASSESAIRALQSLPGVAAVEVLQAGPWCHLRLQRSGADIREAVGQTLLTNGWAVREMRYEMASLEELFRNITQGEAAAPLQADPAPAAVTAA